MSSVISGQAIGTFAATVLIWGWNVDGPVAVARANTSQQRAAVYARSMRSRLLLTVVVLPATVVVAVLVAVPGLGPNATWMAVATALAGLSPAWFCIGLGQPGLLALYDTLPRFTATVVAAPLILLTDSLWVYAATSALATIISLWVFHRRYSPGEHWFPLPPRDTLRDLGSQARTAGINLTGSAYASTPTPIATLTSTPAASGSLATADSLYRFGIFSVVALGNAFQGWTIEPGVEARHRRHLAAIAAHVGLGLAGLIVITTLGPLASLILFAGRAQATTLLCLYYGVAFLFLSASTPLIRNLLIPAARQALILRWTTISAIIGVAAMLAAGISGHPTLIPLGMAASEAILCAALLGPALRCLRSEATVVSGA
ncbi:MAG: polysaccharide biosynthesis protein [Actinomycetota bacterium]